MQNLHVHFVGHFFRMSGSQAAFAAVFELTLG